MTKQWSADDQGLVIFMGQHTFGVLSVNVYRTAIIHHRLNTKFLYDYFCVLKKMYNFAS